jgi:Protein of unknown function (DUF4058)
MTKTQSGHFDILRAAMKSPFPGMDPYLEATWPDVHAAMIGYARSQLVPLLERAGYKARIEGGMAVEHLWEDNRIIRPDVSIERSPKQPSNASSSTATAVLEYPTTAVPVLEVDEVAYEAAVRFIEIRTAQDNQLVTVIELLSPTNKLPGTAREKYLKKRRDYREAHVNVVEIDLIRQGKREFPAPMMKAMNAHAGVANSTYLACVGRVAKSLDVYRHAIFPIALGAALPVIPVPLLPKDRDVALALQPLVDRAYHEGAYGDTNYTIHPNPPFNRDELAIVNPLFKAAKLNELKEVPMPVA